MSTQEKLSALINTAASADTAKSPSTYEQRNVRWASLSYDKKALVEFLAEYEQVKGYLAYLLSVGAEEWSRKDEADYKDYKVKLATLEAVAADLDWDFVEALIKGEEWAERHALCESIAREAAIEILTDGKYSVATLRKMTHLPMADYQLITKRVQELAAVISDITAEAPNGLASGIPGA